MLNFNEYQKQAMVFRKDTANTMYAFLGLAAEAGEVCDKMAKIIRDKDGCGEFADNDAIAKELGDVLWFVAAIADDLGYSLADIANRNIAKLSDRLARNKIGGSGDDR